MSLLLSGSPKPFLEGIHFRGDINVLLLVDPSTAKYQLLICVNRTSSLSI